MLRDNGVTFPNIIDSSDAAEKVCFQAVPGHYGSAVPMSYIIDRDGKVVDAWYGYEKGEPKAIAAMQKAGGELAEAIRRDVRGQGGESPPPRSPPPHSGCSRPSVPPITTMIGHSTDDWKHFPAKGVNYIRRPRSPWLGALGVQEVQDKSHHRRATGQGLCRPDGSPTIHFELHLKDGEILRRRFAFPDWDPEEKQWIGWEGLDWHLHVPSAKDAKKS